MKLRHSIIASDEVEYECFLMSIPPRTVDSWTANCCDGRLFVCAPTERLYFDGEVLIFSSDLLPSARSEDNAES